MDRGKGGAARKTFMGEEIISNKERILVERGGGTLTKDGVKPLKHWQGGYSDSG